ARGTVGLNMEWNLASQFSDNPALYLAVQSGAHVAKVGSSDADFFGGGSTSGQLEDATLVGIPADLKVGYNISESARVSVHGLGNVIYRRSAGAFRLADDAPAASESAWVVVLNIEGVIEDQVGDYVVILAWLVVILAVETLFVGTLSANIML